ncbi:MAG: amino acid adenylation domain-containing protein, partial [Thermoanaerobaculia bacterium]
MDKCLQPSFRARLEALAIEQQSDLAELLLANWYLLLSRLSDQSRPVIGIKLSGRNYEGLDGAVGLFARYLPLSAELGNDLRWIDLVARLRTAVAEAEARQEYFAWEKLPPIEGFETPWIPFCFDAQPELPSFEAGGLSFTVLHLDAVVDRFELLLRGHEEPGALRLELLYDRGRYSAMDGRRVLARYSALLESAVADPSARIGDLDLLGRVERHRLLVEGNATAPMSVGDSPVHRLFEAQVERTPERTAVLADGGALSYRALDRRAEQLADALIAGGIENEEVVAVCLDRGADLVMALLAILKAGGAFLPLDPGNPRRRLAFLLADAGVRRVLTQESLAPALPWDDDRVWNLDAAPPPDAAEPRGRRRQVRSGQLAYVLYTSGSTGRPKGVMVTHRSLVSYLSWINQRLIDERVEMLPLVTPPTFDAAWKQIFAPLLRGGCVWTLSPATLADPRRLLAALSRRRRIGFNGVVSLWRSLLDAWEMVPEPPSDDHLAAVYVGGEQLEAEDLQRTFARLPGVELWNLYGPTEVTANASAGRMSPGSTVHLGRPLAGYEIYVLDRRLRPQPTGVRGEIHVGGAGVARGYRGRPGLTAECFVPDPFSGRLGARMYKTGDIARLRPDGCPVFLGRGDHQVKVHGIRIELEEIEAVLRRQPPVADAAVAQRRVGVGEPRLVAYVVPRAGSSPTASELRRVLAESLPEAMVPSFFVRLSELPRTSSGKTDRLSLPEPDLTSENLEQDYRAPRTATEEILAGLWSELLGVARAGRHDRFLALGGHSLLAVQLLSRIQQAFQLELPLRIVLEAADLEDMAARIDRARRSGGADSAPPLAPAAQRDDLPLSLSQERLWFLDQLTPGQATFNIPAALRFHGSVDPAALERSLREVVRRHEVLRTRFETDAGRPVRRLCAPDAVRISWIDLRGLEAPARRREEIRLITAESQRGFDLAAAPPLRIRLLVTGQEQGVVLVTLHHIISDGWSSRILFRELATLYEAYSRGRPSPLPELPIQYADYAAWQRSWFGSGAREQQLDFWRRRLEGLTATTFPTDRPRPAVLSNRGATVSWSLDADVDALRALSARHGATLQITLLAIFKATLHFFTGSHDITIGTNAVNRHRPGTELLIGFFVNQLVQRSDLSGDPTFLELLTRVRQTAIEAW